MAAIFADLPDPNALKDDVLKQINNIAKGFKAIMGKSIEFAVDVPLHL